MNKINFIGLELFNPNWESSLDIIKSNFLEYIDIPKCTEMGLESGVDYESHVTLFYNKQHLNKGPNWYYWFITIKLADLWKQLKSSDLVLDRAVVNTFDNNDSRVLKLDLNNCNCFELLKQLHSEIENSQPGLESQYPKYDPHITMTYLKSTTPNEVIDQIRSKLLLNNLKVWSFSKLMMGGDNFNTKLDIS